MGDHVWTDEEIKTLREQFGESQSEFARRFRIGPPALQAWEQGRVQPPGPIGLLLDILRAAITGQPSPVEIQPPANHPVRKPKQYFPAPTKGKRKLAAASK